MCTDVAKPIFTTRSSTIHKVDYNEKDKMMEIEFRSGNTYRYYDVPPRMWKIFQLYIECEGSAGSFFNEYIKKVSAASQRYLADLIQPALPRRW